MTALLRWVLTAIRVVLLTIGFSGLALALTDSGSGNRLRGDWFRFYLPWDDASASLIDADIEKPAGQRGFVRVNSEGQFQFQDGTPARFWGANIGGPATTLPGAKAEGTAARMAKYGFNLVVFDTLDQVLIDNRFDDTQHLDETALNQWDYFVSQLRNQGIYYRFSLMAFRTFKAGDGVVDWDKPEFNGDYTRARLLRTAVFFDPQIQTLYQQFARELLTHRNPYTGLSYVDDSALAMVLILNETTLGHGWLRDQLNADSPKPVHLTKYYSDQLDVLWNEWLLIKYRDRDTLERAWYAERKWGLLPDEDPSQWNVRRMLYLDRGRFSRARVYDTLTFYVDLETKFFKAMTSFLKEELGLKVPVGGTQIFHGTPNQMVQVLTDYTGTNVFWQHPALRSRADWPKPEFELLNTPMVRAEAGPPPQALEWDWLETRNTIYGIAFTAAAAGKPLTVAEYNHGYPNQYSAEFPLIVSAYGRFQDWDAIVLYNYIRSQDVQTETINPDFYVFNNPALMTQMPTASRMFREEYVKPALNTYTVAYSKEEVLESFLRCGFKIYCVLARMGVDPHWALVRKVENSFDGGAGSPPKPQPPANPYISDTAELVWDIENGLVQIDTPRAQAFVGFLKQAVVGLTNLALRAETGFGAVSLIALDGSPISESKSMLLTASSLVINQGLMMALNPLGSYSVLTAGEGPALVQAVSAEVTLRLTWPTESVKVHRLDARGNPAGTLTVTHLGDGQIRFRIGQDKTLWYAILRQE